MSGLKAPEAAVARVQGALGCLPLRCSCGELTTCDGERRCAGHNLLWEERGCPSAVAAADAAVAPIAAQTLRDLARDLTILLPAEYANAVDRRADRIEAQP